MEEIAGIRKAIGETDLSERYKAILLTLVEEVVNIKKTASDRAAALERLALYVRGWMNYFGIS